MISRALILDNNKVLLIHRFKNEREYFVFPGGHIKEGESAEEALVREIKEETHLDIHIDKHLGTRKNAFDDSHYHFFLVTTFSGNLQLGGPELEKDSKENKYILEWHNLSEISELHIVPESFKNRALKNFVK